MLRDLLKTGVKIALAPVYVPYKVGAVLKEITECKFISNYEYWHHDSGIPTDEERESGTQETRESE
jgi:hypothetical protein